MVEALSIIIDRCPKGRPRKKESYTIGKIGFVHIFHKNKKRSYSKMKKVILFLVLSLTLSAVIGFAGCGLSPTTTVYGTGPAGGYIFYDKGSYSDGWRYLEAAPASTEWTGKEWGSYGTFIGGTETGIGTGQSNTNTIVTW
ncbi:MAG: hypothetical protein ACTSPQ_19565, partial [Candidatus Helarchaeota archaeon]